MKRDRKIMIDFHSSAGYYFLLKAEASLKKPASLSAVTNTKLHPKFPPLPLTPPPQTGDAACV